MGKEQEDRNEPIKSQERNDMKFKQKRTNMAIDCTGSYPWQKELNNPSLQDIEVDRILGRRTHQLNEAYEQSLASNDEKLMHKLEEEWTTLVLQKDHRLRQKINKENERTKQQCMKQLHKILQTLGSFSFTEPKDAVLKKNLFKMYHQVGKYCQRNNIPTDIEHKTGLCDENICDTADKTKTAQMAPPPPPPPPLPPPFVIKHTTFGTQTPTQHPKRQKMFLGTASPSVYSRQPLGNVNDELLNRIRGGQGREGLRSTPVKRSPGGTPHRRHRRMSESDTSDLITVALKRKFKNVAVCSPKENNSPKLISPNAKYP